MLFPINSYFRYPGVALHYLTVRDGSWGSNLLLHWFQTLRGFDWCICVNVETRGPAHLRKIVCSLVCSCGWGSRTMFRQIFMTGFQHDLLSGMLDILSHWGPSSSVPRYQWLTVVDTWDRLQDQCNCGLKTSFKSFPVSSTMWLRDFCYCAWWTQIDFIPCIYLVAF